MATSAVTQANRFLSVDTVLGADVLVIERFVSNERMSGLFHIEVDLLADVQKKNHLKVTPDKLVGQKVTIGVVLPGGKQRYLNGIFRSFAEGERDDRFVHYHAEIVPWLWLHTLQADSRIFQNMSPDDAVKKVLTGGQLEFRLDRKLTVRDYIVQYRETTFNFASRLMEEEGVYYFFEHDKGKHTLVFSDAKTFKPCADKVRFYPKIGHAGDGKTVQEDVIFTWHPREELRTGKHSLRDHNFQLPSQDLEQTKETAFKRANNNSLEVFDYPGEFAEHFNKPDARMGDVSTEGRTIVAIRMEEDDTRHISIAGTSDLKSLVSGYRFELKGHENDDYNKQFVITSLQAEATQTPSYISGEAVGQPYRNRFECIPMSVPFRPARTTPKPVIAGPQTAVVVGPAGEEIYVDKFGRVKVQFHWDRQGKKDDNSSCWIRVSQPWAGTQWGMIMHPRIGQDVIITFLEGDPDKPILTGRVHNPAEMPPYTLPDKKTVSTWKSRSSKGGSAENYNEIRFEDLKGSEQIFVNAEKDMDMRVEHDSREFIGNNRSLIVTTDQMEQVGGDKHLTVAKNHQESIGSDMSLAVGANRMTQIASDDSLTVNANVNEKVAQNKSLQVGMGYHEKMMTSATEAVQEIHLKCGMNIIVEAGLQLTLKGPGGFVVIGPDGVTIQGILVKINSGGAAGAGAGASPKSPADPKDPKAPDEADDGPKFTKKK